MLINIKIVYIIAFLCGASTMILELVGARILAPYVGTSLFVWASLISVILFSLSLGYWVGGIAADKNPSKSMLSSILLTSAISISMIAVFKNFFLNLITPLIPDVRLASLLLCLIFFTVPTLLLGIVTPYLAKIVIKNIKNSGTVIGKLYAISTIGSITGTLTTGFLLVSFLSSIQILFMISIILFLCSLLVSEKINIFKTIVLLTFFFLLLLFSLYNASSKSFETQYHAVSIIDTIRSSTNENVRILKLGAEWHSGIYLDSDELLFPYLKQYDLISVFNPDFKKTLMIGGGAFTYPTHYISKYPNASIDVVEIDPKLTDLSKQYFKLKASARLKIINEDGRIFLNKSQTKYDNILIDAVFSYYSIPFHLTTKETVSKIYNMLSNDGVVIVNVISSLEGENSKLIYAEYKTYKQVFKDVRILPVISKTDKYEIQNIMLVALKSKNSTKLADEYKLDEGKLNKIPVLTDEFAPVDQYIANYLNK